MSVFSYRWPIEKQRKEVEKRLTAYIREYIYPYHPHYRRLFKENGIDPASIRTYRDVQQIPFTYLHDIVTHPREFILQPKLGPGSEDYGTEPLNKKYIAHAMRRKNSILKPRKTRYLGKLSPEEKEIMCIKNEWQPIHLHLGGSYEGSEPAESYYTYYDIWEVLPKIVASIAITGIGREWRTMNLMTAAPHVTFFQPILTKLMCGNLIFDTCGPDVVPAEAQLELVSGYELDCVISSPTYIDYWLNLALRMKKDGRLDNLRSLKLILLGAEDLTPSMRQHIHDRLQKLGASPRVLRVYGSTQIKAGFYECDEGSGIHLNPEYYYWEIVDPKTKEPVGEGEQGVLVFSHIGWRGSTFLRCCTGDLIHGGMTWEKCSSCGLTMPIIHPPISRLEI